MPIQVLLCKFIIKLIFYITNFYIRYFINKNFKLESYLLRMTKLEDKYSRVYMYKVLLDTLSDFNIKYNIKRYIFIYLITTKRIINTNMLIVLHEIILLQIIL